MYQINGIFILKLISTGGSITVGYFEYNFSIFDIFGKSISISSILANRGIPDQIHICCSLHDVLITIPIVTDKLHVGKESKKETHFLFSFKRKYKFLFVH
jgi:hypothetical protein